jgi:hypothetical protein
MPALRRTAGVVALLACAVAVLCAPAPAATREQREADAFQVPEPSVPLRDAVIDHPTRAMARSLASASASRVPVNDGHGRSVEMSVSTLCQAICTDASPTDLQNLANFLGSLAHGDEMNSVTVMVVAPTPEMATNCGPGALACYYPSQNLLYVSGDNDTAGDGATRDYVLAHEYGHHLANHRNNAPFDDPALDWGPKNWATYERICEGVKSGVYFPGNEDAGAGGHYYSNPGEAFAEAYAQNRLPGIVGWEWNDSLKPDATAFHAIDRDALQPWTGPSRLVVKGRLGRRHGRITKTISTPLDGQLTLKLKGPRRADFDLILRDTSGRTLDYSTGLTSRESVSYTICGQTQVRAMVKRNHGAGPYKLTELVP